MTFYKYTWGNKKTITIERMKIEETFTHDKNRLVVSTNL